MTIPMNLKIKVGDFVNIRNNTYMFNILMIFPLIYTIELIIGFSGSFIVVFGLPIRFITFVLAFISIYIAFILKYISDNNGIKYFFNDLFLNFTFLDFSVLLFLLFNFIWATVIPLINGVDITMSISEIDGMSTMAIFFPASYLIRQRHINFKLYKNIIIILVVLFSLLHILFYAMDKMNIGFIEEFFKVVVNMLGGSGNIPNIIRGHGYTRVIFPSTILIFVGIYLILQNVRNNLLLYISMYVILVIAILSTITKSLMLGGLIGGLFMMIYYIFIVKDTNITKIVGTVFLITLVSVVILDSMVFDNLITQRMSNLYISDETSIGTGLSEVEKNELEGSIEGNQIRIKQSKDLFNKFKENPITGFGYGSYLKDNIRGERGYYYLYEVFIPAMLMKIGIIGFLAFILFGISILYYIYINLSYKNSKIPLVLFGFCSMAVIVQTNPLLLGFSGMFIITILLLDIEYLISDSKYKSYSKILKYT